MFVEYCGQLAPRLLEHRADSSGIGILRRKLYRDNAGNGDLDRLRDIERSSVCVKKLSGDAGAYKNIACSKLFYPRGNVHSMQLAFALYNFAFESNGFTNIFRIDLAYGGQLVFGSIPLLDSLFDLVVLCLSLGKNQLLLQTLGGCKLLGVSRPVGKRFLHICIFRFHFFEETLVAVPFGKAASDSVKAVLLLPAPVAETFGFCYVSVDALDIPFRILGFRKGGCRLFLFIVRRKDSADALLPFVPDAARSASLRHIAVKIPMPFI